MMPLAKPSDRPMLLETPKRTRRRTPGCGMPAKAIWVPPLEAERVHVSIEYVHGSYFLLTVVLQFIGVAAKLLA